MHKRISQLFRLKKKVNNMTKVTINGKEINPEDIKLSEKQIKAIVASLNC